MKLRAVICIALLACVGIASAQTPDQERAKKSDAILVKIRQLDLMNQILPLLLTKDEIPKLLTAIEKTQDNVKKVQEQEAKDLLNEEKDLDVALTDAVDKGEVPKKEYMLRLMTLIKAFRIRRDIAANENADTVYDACKGALNAGQLKVMASSLDPKYFDPSMQKEKMSDEQLTKFFIKQIILDPSAYGLLEKLGK